MTDSIELQHDLQGSSVTSQPAMGETGDNLLPQEAKHRVTGGTPDDAHAVIDRVGEVYADQPQDRLDGLTVDMGDWWFNLRPSNTEPLLRLNLEAPTTEDVEAHVAEVKGHFGV